MGSFFAACSRPAKESLEGAKVCARPVLEMIRSAVIVTFRQTSLRTSASYAANPHSRQEIFSLLKDPAEEKPSSEMRYTLDRPHEGSDDKSSGNDKHCFWSRACRSTRPPPDDSPLWLLSRRALLHCLRTPSRFRLRRSRSAECVFAANRTDFVRELIVRVADFSCAGKRAYHRFHRNSHAGAGRPCVGDCSGLYEHAREPVFPGRRQLLLAQC